MCRLRRLLVSTLAGLAILPVARSEIKCIDITNAIIYIREGQG
jgi:hypothetical protein